MYDTHNYRELRLVLDAMSFPLLHVQAFLGFPILSASNSGFRWLLSLTAT